MTQVDQPLSQNAPDTLHARQDQIWTRGNPQQPSQWINVAGSERGVSLAAGGILAALGLSRGSLPGLVVAAIGGSLVYRGVSGHCHMYQALGIDTAHSNEPARPEEYFNRGIHVEQSFTINKSPWELYAFWRDFTNLPRIMSHLESVTCLDGNRSHWVAKAPAIAGGKVEWDAEIINDEPNALIAWRSLGNADVDNAGSVRFVPAPADRGTEVKVVLDYIPPAGRLGSWIARMFGEEPQIQINEDLRKFKRIMETGEFATTKGQPRGTCAGEGYRQE
ncbi:MAG TPA: SRPBCC family protein [Tepidisphaeraceae bacterium]|nr:SRPBCC family protein [Tepidisphaeraceae bacterium]